MKHFWVLVDKEYGDCATMYCDTAGFYVKGFFTRKQALEESKQNPGMFRIIKMQLPSNFHYPKRPVKVINVEYSDDT